MTASPVLDTHAWIWWVNHEAHLPASVIEYLDDLPPGQRPRVCDISLWEIAMLVERGRLALTVSLSDWLEAAAHPRSVEVVPVTPAIAAEVAALPTTFHRDPADRLIVATCRVLKAPLLTYDRMIARSRLVARWKPTR